MIDISKRLLNAQDAATRVGKYVEWREAYNDARRAMGVLDAIAVANETIRVKASKEPSNAVL